MKKKARRRLERKQTVLQARRDPTARRNVADAARAKGSIRRKTAAMAAPAYPSAAPLNAKAGPSARPTPSTTSRPSSGPSPRTSSPRACCAAHESRASPAGLPFVVLQKFGPAMLKMHRLLPSGDTVTSAEVVAAAAGVHAHLEARTRSTGRGPTCTFRDRACFAPQAVGQYPPTCERHKQWRREYAARVAAVERNSPLRDLLGALGPRRRDLELAVGSFSSVWLGCRESLKAADDDYNYVLEWLIRALGYALEVPDSCFGGVGHFVARGCGGLRYRDAYDACITAGLPVALISAGCVFASLDPDPLPRGTDAKEREKHFKFKVKGSPHAWLLGTAPALEFRARRRATTVYVPHPCS
ncbi:hypothetical protein JL721_9540 [Aureococcus anophagefferens]|nr:hypothetical protein JL721_9540 [Aureococcus anophagefferens]